MATRKHSIKVPVNFGAIADLTSGVTASIGGTPSIYIPENSTGATVTFTAANLYLGYQDMSTVTGGTLAGLTVSVTLGASAASNVNVVSSVTIANSGENMGGIFGPIDYTAYFNQSWGNTATNKTAAVTVNGVVSTGTGTTLRGLYGYFELTYTFSDAAATRIQTVCIPYESSITTLGVTGAGSTFNMVSLTASGWLSGYASPVIRHRWIEIKGNCNDNNTVTNHNMGISFDTGSSPAGATVSLPIRISALASDTWQIYQVDASGLTAGNTHTIQLWSTLATRWANVIVNEWVSFEYTVSGTTQVLNYLEMPLDFSPPINGTTSTQVQRYSKTFNIQEPATITMQRCGVEITYATDGSATLNIKGGTQSAYRAYAQTSNVATGQFSLQHLLDSTSASGQGVTLTRGENTIIVDMYRSVGSAQFVTGVIKVLYTSNVASAGVDAHNHTCWESARPFTAVTTVDDTITNSFSIPETSYWINAAAQRYFIWTQPSGVGITFPIAVNSYIGITAGESIGAGLIDTNNDFMVSDQEMGFWQWTSRLYPVIKRYPGDPSSDRVYISGTRNYRNTFSIATRYGMGPMVGWHSIASTVSGTISGSAGGSVAIKLFRTDTNEFVTSTTQTGNGAYSLTVYNDTLNYIVTAYESATLKGASKTSTPTSGFDIGLTGGGGSGGGEYFF